MTIPAAVNGVKHKPKGFQIPDKIAVISFENTDYDGGEVRAKLNVNMAYFTEIQRAVGESDSMKMAELFGDQALISWNLETSDGDPIPADAEGMKQIPVELVNLIIGFWAAEVANIPDPLDEKLSSLNTLAAASTNLGDQ